MEPYEQGEQFELFPRMTQESQEEAEQQILKNQQVVDYQILEYPIEVIVSKYTIGKNIDNNEIFIPNYQRKFVWDIKKQSKFIESIMIGLPIPYIFAADNQGRMEIVDGSQRIRTLEAFSTNKFSLEGLKKLTKLNNFRHKDLPISRQRRFNKKPIRIIELTEKATLEARKDMFERINTTPTILTDMEVRKGMYEGGFYDFIQKCANNPKFKILCPISDKREDREERPEMVVRFFAYAERYKDFVHVVRDFIDEYMESKLDNFDVVNLDNDFENMLDFVDKHFPYGFRKSVNAKSTPRIRFEAISVGVHLALKENPQLIPPPIESWLNSKEFKEHTRSDASNNKNKVSGRFEYVRDKLLGND